MSGRLHLASRRLLAAALLAAVLTGIAGSGLLRTVDQILADALYQQGEAPDGAITVIGIDQVSLDKLGPFAEWGRAKMADAVRILSESGAAVIGLDVLYVGASGDAAGDAALAEACGLGTPVVAAGAATFGSDIVENGDGSFYVNDYVVEAFDAPYPALAETAQTGHVNAMYDLDGVLRHGILQLTLPDGQTVPSFHLAVAQAYRESQGETLEKLPPADSRYRWYVPFGGGPGAYSDGYSFSDLLAGEIPADGLAGRIVLIGPYAAGMQDDFPTAIDRSRKMYGVEYQANMVDALLRGDFKKEAAAAPQLAALFLLCFAAQIFFVGRKPLPAAVAWLALGCGSLGLSYAAYQAGVVLDPLYPPLAVTVLFVITVAANYLRAAMEKRKVTQTFQRYVAPEIVGELLREGSDQLALGGKLCEIAVLFVDMRGFTAMSEVLAPAQVVDIINRYLTFTSRCIFRNQGTLDKYVGDCTMAFWGAPLPQEDCAFKAVKTALEMVEGAKALEEDMERDYGLALRFGVGVNYGPAVVGNIGSPDRMDYTAIGDTVNTASRLEGSAPAGQILISRAVANELKDRVVCTSLGSAIHLKGKAEGFEVLRVEGLAEAGLHAASAEGG